MKFFFPSYWGERESEHVVRILKKLITPISTLIAFITFHVIKVIFTTEATDQTSFWIVVAQAFLKVFKNEISAIGISKLALGLIIAVLTMDTLIQRNHQHGANKQTARRRKNTNQIFEAYYSTIVPALIVSGAALALHQPHILDISIYCGFTATVHLVLLCTRRLFWLEGEEILDERRHEISSRERMISSHISTIKRLRHELLASASKIKALAEDRAEIESRFSETTTLHEALEQQLIDTEMQLEENRRVLRQTLEEQQQLIENFQSTNSRHIGLITDLEQRLSTLQEALDQQRAEALNITLQLARQFHQARQAPEKDATSKTPGEIDKPKFLVVRGNGCKDLVLIQNIILVEAEDGWVRVHTFEGTKLGRAALKDLVLELGEDFVMLSQSVIVNILQVRSFTSQGGANYAVLKKGDAIKISRGHWPNIRDMLNSWPNI